MDAIVSEYWTGGDTMPAHCSVLFALASPFLSAGLLPADEPPKKLSDAEITKLIVGKWSEEIKEENVTGKGITIYKKDGTFSADGMLMAKGKTITIKGTGTWKVSDGVLIETIETVDPPVKKKGDMTKDKVLSITAKMMKVRTESGREVVKTRVSD
jgi:hypothetical protein